MMSSAAVATTNAAPPSAVGSGEGEKKSINPELWQACAGPLVNLPAAGTHVVYFPQGHSEQVAASMKKGIDAQIPNYPDLSSKLLCLLHSVTLHADPDTDEVYAQMTLQPVPSFDQEALLRSDLSLKVNKPQPEFFCKTLTASDTSTHGGFSVPRRAAEKIFPSLDYSIQPPAQELTARDLHDNLWTFRHIYRGQPKRHLLTTGWSLFVSGKRLSAGDSVLFIRDKNHNLLLGLRRAIRQPANLPSSVLSSDSMRIGILAAAAHAAANNSPFTVFYNPRASPSEFVIPLAKYYKATCGQQISPGMRFRMLFETEESGTRRYMGTVTCVSELDSVRWKNSQWRNLQVGWDEAIAGERFNRVSAWEVEPVTAPFFICPPFFGAKRSRDDTSEFDSLFKRTMPSSDFSMKMPHVLGGLSLAQRMSLHQSPCLANPMQTNFSDSSPGFSLQGLPAPDISCQLGTAAVPLITQLQFNVPKQMQASQPLDQLPDTSQTRQVQPHVLQSPTIVRTPNTLDNASSLQNGQLQRRTDQIPPQKQQQRAVFHESYRGSAVASLLSKQSDHVTGNQIQLELRKFEQHQQSLLSQQSSQLQDTSSPNERQGLCSWAAEMQQVLVTTPPQSQSSAHQINKNNAENTRVLPNLPQPPNLQQQQELPGLRFEGHGHVSSISNHPCIAGVDNSTTAAAAVAQPAIINNVLSFSTSPSNVVQTITNMGPQTNGFGDGMALSSIAASSASNLEAMATNGNTFKGLHQRSDIIMPSVNVSEPSDQDLVGQHFYQNVPGSHLDYLDTSSATSASLSQGDAHLKRHNSSSFNSRSMLSRDTCHGEEVLGATTLASDPGSTDFSNISSGSFITSYENGKDVQQDPSSSMVTQSFDVPDMAFNSIDSAMSGGQFLNQDAWGQPPAYQRMRTYTKVYKRGAVGRSIDVTSYSGYEELKQDLARRFGIEGQLEDRGRVGWKLVYVDHENDVLLLGDDPWEEFVRFVRCIKILSPQEVQRMSLDADYGNVSLPNQACSSSDGGLV